MKLVKLFYIALFGWCAATLAGCGSQESDPEKVAIAWVEYTYKGDADNMIKLIHLPDGKKVSENELKGKMLLIAAEAAERANRKGGVKEVVVESSDIDEEKGTGSVETITHFKNEDSEPRKDRVKLIRFDDEWKVNL